MKATLMIELNLENNKTTTISIPDPRDDVAKADVVTVAEEIVGKKAIQAAGVQATSFKRAYIRTVEEKELE